MDYELNTRDFMYLSMYESKINYNLEDRLSACDKMRPSYFFKVV